MTIALSDKVVTALLDILQLPGATRTFKVAAKAAFLKACLQQQQQQMKQREVHNREEIVLTQQQLNVTFHIGRHIAGVGLLVSCKRC